MLTLGKKRNKRKKRSCGGRRNAPGTAPPQALRHATPEPVRSVAKLQDNEQPFGDSSRNPQRASEG